MRRIASPQKAPSRKTIVEHGGEPVNPRAYGTPPGRRIERSEQKVRAIIDLAHGAGCGFAPRFRS